MIVTIHQPEHFPYMGFFQKVAKADIFIVLDSVSFRKNYFQNRNKILTSAGHDDWITVPVEKKATSKKIKDVLTSEDPRWRIKVVKKIQQNFHFDTTHIYSHKKLIDINMDSIKWAFEKTNISPRIFYSSELSVSGTKSELLANLCKEVGATKYISGPSGKSYIKESFFKDEKIEIEYFHPKVKNNYSCLYNLLK